MFILAIRKKTTNTIIAQQQKIAENVYGLSYKQCGEKVNFYVVPGQYSSDEKFIVQGKNISNSDTLDGQTGGLTDRRIYSNKT